MPAVGIHPRRLLVHARELVEHHQGAGRPRPTWLRRSISSAYYAAFHAVAMAMARQLLPDGSAADRQHLSRSLDHRPLKTVSAWVRDGQEPDKAAAPLITRAHADPDVRTMAQLLVQLQEARHLADYDHRASVSKEAATHRVQEATTVVDTLRVRGGTPPLAAYLALLALHTNLR